LGFFEDIDKIRACGARGGWFVSFEVVHEVVEFDVCLDEEEGFHYLADVLFYVKDIC
jgi:hypothetical protein